MIRVSPAMLTACILRDPFTVLNDLMSKSFLNGKVSGHTCPESDAESGILPMLALNQMTDSHLMEASLSKQTQYTAPLWDPPIQKRNSCLESTGILFRGPFDWIYSLIVSGSLYISLLYTWPQHGRLISIEYNRGRKSHSKNPCKDCDGVSKQ